MSILLFLIVFEIKHLVADYFLQGKYMLGKFKPGWDFVLPLASHCFVHFVFTFLISFFVTKNYKTSLCLSLFDFTTHFLIDRFKASPKLLGRFKTDQKQFWWALGFDQFSHHIIHYVIILYLIDIV